MWILIVIIQAFSPETPIQSFHVVTPSQIACQHSGESAKQSFQAQKVEYVCVEWKTPK